MGAALLLAGGALIVSVFWPGSSPWQATSEPVAVPADYKGRYPIETLTRWVLHNPDDGRRLTLYLARYHGSDGQPRRAIVPPPESTAWRRWQSLGEALRQLEPDALILAWWDDAQRVDLFSGRKVWVHQPTAEAFPGKDQKLWHLLSGGFDDGEEELQRLARWLAMPAEDALAAMRREAPAQPHYLLISTDLLTRLDEIERLAGTKFPLEVKIFPPNNNLHAQIAAVQRWAGETGLGYLPQKVPAGIAAWRLTGKTNQLLLRLLLFTTNPPAPPADLFPVFQSPDRQLQLYRVSPKG